MVAFVDLQPEANWGHDCRYLLVDPETGELQMVMAQFPPFLRGGPHFDHFARDWIAAMNNADPYGGLLASNPDSNSDGCIAAKEAYDFADTHKHYWDTPV